MAALLVLVLVLVSGVLVAVEMALFSVRRERLELAVQQGDKRARFGLGLLDDPAKYLTASNAALTAIGVVAGSIVTPWLTDPAELWLRRVAVPAAWIPAVAYVTCVTALTLLTLVFGNLVPKQIGFVWAETVTLRGARFMGLVIALAKPVSALVEPLARAVARLLRVPKEAAIVVEEGDLLLLMEEGLRSGRIDRREHSIARRAFSLSDRPVKDAMTPRGKISWLDANLPSSQARQKVASCNRSWVVVCDGSLDRVLGTVKARDYLALPSPPDRATLVAMLKAPAETQVGASLLSALERLGAAESRILLVLGNNGQMEGLLTANDVVSALVGPIRSLD
ncbi:MAG: CNNM domain-containing protein [Fimbriimonadaceae bacterium]